MASADHLVTKLVVVDQPGAVVGQCVTAGLQRRPKVGEEAGIELCMRMHTARVKPPRKRRVSER